MRQNVSQKITQLAGTMLKYWVDDTKASGNSWVKTDRHHASYNT